MEIMVRQGGVVEKSPTYISKKKTKPNGVSELLKSILIMEPLTWQL